jgi:hypothetical protein
MFFLGGPVARPRTRGLRIGEYFKFPKILYRFAGRPYFCRKAVSETQGKCDCLHDKCCIPRERDHENFLFRHA